MKFKIVLIGLAAGFLWAVSEPPPIDQIEVSQPKYEVNEINRLLNIIATNTSNNVIASTSTTTGTICTIGRPATMTTMVYK